MKAKARIATVRRGIAAVQTDLGGRRGIGVSAFVLALVTAGAMAHVGVRMKGIEVAYDLGRERRRNTELEEERRRLNIEIGMLKDPGRVVSIARDKLKMGPPAQADIVRLAPGQVLGARPEPALPARRGARPPPAKRSDRATASAKPRVHATAAPPAEEASPGGAAAETPDEAAPAATERQGDE